MNTNTFYKGNYKITNKLTYNISSVLKYKIYVYEA